MTTTHDVRCTAVGYQPASTRTLICNLRSGHDGEHEWVVREQER